MTKAALSTMWGLSRFGELEGFFRAAESMGFSRFELNHGVDTRRLAGLDGRLITSVHEPCPADVSTEELRRRDWLVSSRDGRSRREGIRAIMRSIDLARRLGAEAVIVHPGRIDLEDGPETELRSLFKAGRRGSPEYDALLRRYQDQRAGAAAGNLAAAAESLKELADYAADRGVKLGLENRYHYNEIPSPDELDELLDKLPAAIIGFWYDVGHAETLDRLGLIRGDEWLRRFSGRMLGVHLHDVDGIDDHRPAGQGQIDWEGLARLIPDGVLRTLEFRDACTAEEVAAGAMLLRAKGLIA